MLQAVSNASRNPLGTLIGGENLNDHIIRRFSIGIELNPIPVQHDDVGDERASTESTSQFRKGIANFLRFGDALIVVQSSLCSNECLRLGIGF
jgi:hypothetical protein